MGFIWYYRVSLILLILLSIVEPLLLLVLHGNFLVTFREYVYIFNLSFTKQISFQGYYTLFFVGLRLVKSEDRVSITFLYILFSNIGFLVGSIVGGYSTIQIL
jgi:hypothetical protein